jgi:hypothetical protein
MVSASNPLPMRPGGGPTPPTAAVVSAATIRGARNETQISCTRSTARRAADPGRGAR